NKWEVDIMVNKIISYESKYVKNEDWFKRMVVVGGDSWPDPNDPYYEGEEENKLALECMKDFEGIKLWTSLGTLSVENVVEEVSKGCGFLFFDGHGNPMSWATHPPHDEETWIDGLRVQDMHKLSNDGMYPVCVVGGCHNCQFNVSIMNLLKIWEGAGWYEYIWKGETSPECWGWWITRKNGGGSIATLGYTGLDYFAIGNYDNDDLPDCVQYFSGFLHVNFFKGYGVEGIDILGELHVNTLIKYITTHNVYKDPIDCKTVEEWVLLGDPTLKIGGYASP
ncbi:MAG: peptidase C25, partial [Thermoplasmata archaeon]